MSSTGIREKNKTLFAIFSTFGISTLATTILFPVLAGIFLGPRGEYIMHNIPDHFRGLLLGLFLASFPLAQFMVGPIMGDYSDKKGRRSIFIGSVLIEVTGYFLCAVAIHWGLLYLLFLGRIITGIAAGNTSVCLATVVDLSENEKEKVRYFAIGSAIIGLMFIIGPFSGGQMSSLFTNPIYVLAMPMWAGCAFALLNLFILLLFFKETRKQLCIHPFDFLGALHNIERAFRVGQVKNLYLIYFFFLFAWNMIYLFLPAFLLDSFGLSIAHIGTFGTLAGVVWILGTLFMQKIAHYVKGMQKWLFFSFLIISAASIISAFCVKVEMFIIAISVIVFFSGGIWPLLTAAISKTSNQGEQGKMLALSQSVQSFSMLIAPLIGGFFLHKHGSMPFVLTAISALFAAAILVKSGSSPYKLL